MRTLLRQSPLYTRRWSSYQLTTHSISTLIRPCGHRRVQRDLSRQLHPPTRLVPSTDRRARFWSGQRNFNSKTTANANSAPHAVTSATLTVTLSLPAVHEP